jgi:Protein of unknown function (DUF3325)
MISFLVLLLSYVTVVCFGLAKAKHHHQVFGARPTILRQRILSVLAWVSLGLTFGVGLGMASEWLIGTALVAGCLTCAGLLNTTLLTYRPQAILPIFNRKTS